ncbi:MAG: ATP-binding cassette domain-containing protein, partial [Olsenella sp.]|nr:ATP-binding cassette domain-containing protein [Olsenella sp.]
MADSPNEIKRKRQREVLLPVPTPNLVTERDFGKPLVLEVEHLGIDFGGLTAVDDFNIAMGPTEIAGIIGPNGAGKSTTIKMLTGILHPTAGEACVLGLTPWRQRTKLAFRIASVFGQRSQLSFHLPPRDSFELLAAIYELEERAYRQRLGELV